MVIQNAGFVVIDAFVAIIVNVFYFRKELTIQVQRYKVQRTSVKYKVQRIKEPYNLTTL